jgi:hypothetical protein
MNYDDVEKRVEEIIVAFTKCSLRYSLWHTKAMECALRSTQCASHAAHRPAQLNLAVCTQYRSAAVHSNITSLHPAQRATRKAPHSAHLTQSF